MSEMTPERFAELRAAEPSGRSLFGGPDDAEWAEIFDELERQRDSATFNGLLKNAYLNRLAAVFVLSMETDATTAIRAIEDEILDGFLFGQDPMPTSAELFAKANDLESRAMRLDPPGRGR